jgi:endoglycosylceramidase
VVVKLPPYIPTNDGFNYQTSMTDQDMQQMVEWGIKIVRLGVMWEAVERSPGFYDMDYLAQIDSLINRFAQYDIAVIVDNHQDLFSRQLCGEGVPWFYTPKKLDHRCPETLLAQAFHLAGECVSLNSYAMPVDENGLPLVSACQQHDFMTMYTAPEIASAFAGLYNNEDGLRDKLMQFWSVISEFF